MKGIIYSHCDFDGAASAALVSYCTEIRKYQFSTPENIHRKGVSGIDIVCDLPYISGCGLWFDHHSSNIQELKDRGLNPDSMPGANRIAASAAQVIYDYYADKIELPEYFTELVIAANKIDTMSFSSLEEWLSPTAENMINETININSESYPAMCHHLQWLTESLCNNSLAKVSESSLVKERYNSKLKSRQRDIDFLKKISSYLPQDTRNKIIVIDCSSLSFAPKFDKSLALVNNPEADYILLIASDFSYGRKTNNLRLSLSKNFLKQSNKKLGEFMESLMLGGGHDNAAGGMIRAKSKQERLKKLQRFLQVLMEFVN